MSELRGRALALAALEYIEAHPEEWNQETWRCGTACCMAGHVAALAGWRWRRSEPIDDYGRVRIDDSMCSVADPTVLGAVEDVALNALGLFEDEYGTDGVNVHPLFRSENTLADLRRLVDEYLPA